MMTTDEFDGGLIDDVPPTGLHEVSAGDANVLLTRSNGEVRAVSATCPHAGGPLAQGIRHGDRVICPWHKATFCLRTGALLEPPAVDPLERFDVSVHAGRLSLRRAKPVEARTAQPDGRSFVILGAGAAGAVAAQTLREEGFAGRLIMIDAANRVPYDRTILSKYVLSGEPGAEKSPLQTQAFYKTHAIERWTGDIVELDVPGRRVSLGDGTTLDYDAALLATGSAPVVPKLRGIDLDSVHFLRSRSDADAILARAERSERVVILGASFIGMEVAASLRERGLDVTVVRRESEPLEKQLGPWIGGALRRLHERKGVRFALGRAIVSLRADDAVTTVMLDDGSSFDADFVVVGFGVRPVTGFVHGVERDDDGGLRVDSSLRAADGLWAAGDLARFPDGGTGAPLRVEHWRVAQQHGRTAALSMLGREVQYTGTPLFWTIQYLKRVDVVGNAADWDDVVIHGNLGTPEFLAYYVKDGRVVQAAGMDRDTETAALVELFDMRRDWRPDELGEKPSAVLARLDRAR